MQIDSAILYVFRKELDTQIIPAQVRQIHQIDSRVIAIELFCPNGKPLHLIFDTYHPIVYFSETLKKDVSYTPSQTFCMTLRKHLEGARLSSVEQPDFDRFLKFNFDRIETGGKIVTKSLFAELIPSAPNLILTENDKIIDACLRGKKMDRILAPGQHYTRNAYSNRNNILLFTRDEILQILNFERSKDISVKEWLFQTFNGFSSVLVDEIFSCSKINPTTALIKLNNEDSIILSNAIYSIIREILNATALYIYKRPNGKNWATPITISTDAPIRKISANLWIREEIEKSGGLLSFEILYLRKKVFSLLKRETRKIHKIKDELSETQKTETYKLWGTLLSIHAYEKINGKTEISVSNLFNDPPSDEIIPVDPLLSITQNSQLYFKKYVKMKTRSQMGEDKLKECLSKIHYLENVSYFIEDIKSKNDLLLLKEELKESGIDKNPTRHLPRQKKKENDSKITTLSVDGFHILFGKNNIQNEYLTLHKAKKDDLWFHAKSIPGSHVVLLTEGQFIPEEIIAKVAAFAAFHSRGKSSGKVDVDFTRIKYVKKIPGSPPGLVNYTHQSTVTVIPKAL